jgi:transcriptional regulator with XRE-family HTH domain
MTSSQKDQSAVDRAIGARITWYMKYAGGKRRTQAELGEYLELDQSGVSKKLRGERPFTVRELYDVASWLGRPVHDIAAEPEDLDEPPMIMPRARRSSTTHDRNRSTREYTRSMRAVDALHPRLQGETADARDYALAA